MKKTLTLVFILFAYTVSAQEWQTNLATAQGIAKEKNQKIILVFSGSDWCAPCIKLEREIWESEEFKTFSKDNFVLLRADFPRKKKNKLSKEQQEKNNQLAEKYNINGYFPFVVVMNGNGEVLGTTAYKKVSPTEYIKILTSF